ncbi:MAG: deoxyribonuclease IV [Chloroflexi bacterium 54-19]|nr:MAG: deoxyribonuclease IV [Chloroflexi bacterium 54-19]
MLLGAHMSVSGGLHKAFERGKTVGCQTIQIFTKNASQWKAKPLSEADIAAWQKAVTAHDGITPVITHDSYLINLASPAEEAWEKSIGAFKEEIERNSLLGIPYLVTHAGAHMSSGEEVGLSRIAQAVNRVHNEIVEETGNPPGTMILFETTAGQGSSLGYKFEHWGRLLEQLEHPEWTGICFDTCHVFASGYDFRTPEGYDATMSEFDRYIGIQNLRAFHMNDSKQGLGSRVDRHESIGKGHLGLEPFRFLVNDARFANTPMVLETPKGTDDSEDLLNLATLRGLVKGAQE